MESLEALKSAATEAVGLAATPSELEQLRVDFLGKKGSLTGLLKTLGGLSAEERPKAGALINAAKQELTDLISERGKALEASALGEQLDSQRVDVTLPGRGCDAGGLHQVLF